MKFQLLFDRPKWCKKGRAGELRLYNAYLDHLESEEDEMKRREENRAWVARFKARRQAFLQEKERERKESQTPGIPAGEGAGAEGAIIDFGRGRGST